MYENSYVVCRLHKANRIHQRNVIDEAEEIINLVKNQLKPQDGMSEIEIGFGVNASPFVWGSTEQTKGSITFK